MSGGNGTPTEPQETTLRILRGDPRVEEVAALATVVAGRGTAPVAAPAPPSAWSDRARLVRCPLPHGPGAWRASGWRS